MELDLLGALVVGLMGAGHCIGMCGGVSAALTIGVSNPTATSKSSRFSFLLAYNFGRLASYALIGALIGSTFANLAGLSGVNNALVSLRIGAAAMMILLALYIGQWWKGLTYIEKGGQVIWKYISPLAQRFLPMKSPLSALPFGFIWGWLPCGLVYSMLSWSAVSGSALGGAQTMLAFGLGTLPAMLLVGVSAQRMKSVLNNILFKRSSALLLLVYGVHTGYIAFSQLS